MGLSRERKEEMEAESSMIDGTPQPTTLPTLIKKKIKFSSYIRKSRVEQLQSHI
jgi:hypothetical protein